MFIGGIKCYKPFPNGLFMAFLLPTLLVFEVFGGISIHESIPYVWTLNPIINPHFTGYLEAF